jgi:glycosyltransferase involved in cell wall biosynthesis
MNVPSVSIVVPFHDSERHIAACVESLLAQEEARAPYELILVDNASRDRSASIASRYRDVVLLHEPKPGAYAARNTGIRRARGSIVAFTDADCVASRRWVRSMLDGMADASVAILLGRAEYPPEASLMLRLLGEYENAKAEYVIATRPPAFHFAYANNMAVRASVFAELGLFEEWARAADSELVHRVARARPDLRLAYQRSMVVTHMEFLKTRDRVRRLSLYTKTNARIESFRELGIGDRVGVLGQLLRSGRRRT